MKIHKRALNVTLRKLDYSSTVQVGTFWKPLARVVNKMAKLAGYNFRNRGRGSRPQYAPEIRVGKAKFLAVYVTKK